MAKGDWNVEVVSIETSEVVRTIECSSERAADKVESGVLNARFDFDRFFTRVVDARGNEHAGQPTDA